MLVHLSIRDIVLIDKLDLDFAPKLSVLTGETGAGKSILIDALALALGERADASVLREGASRAEVSAVFDVPPPLADWLAERELDTDSLVMRRVIDNQGRSRGYINGVPATLTQLRELGEHLVDIHGQHAHQSLLKADSQRDMLDDHGAHGALRGELAQAWKAWRELARKLEAVERDAASLQQERERLQWQADELDRLALKEDEWDQLQAEHGRLAHAQSLIDGASQTIAALEEDDDAAHARLAAAAQRIAQLAAHDAALAPVSEALESARIALQEAVSDLNSYLARLELDPQRLGEVEARLQAVFDTARKFRLQPDELIERHATLLAQLETLKEAEDVQALRSRTETARAAYDAAAAKLGRARRKAAGSLSKAVTQAMQTLAMTGGRFEVSVEAADPGPHGADAIEFRVAGHAGTKPRPLAKVASGGELARISLALSVIASRAARVPTLIFDEVDTGIGGAVAEVVGRLLRELGSLHQVLCVTHLPQVAACGNTHLRVDKRQERGAALSTVNRLDRGGRVDEIARMLGGIAITATTRKHAREMLGSN